MCTAICYCGLAGRTLDLEFSFGEEVVISPRGFAREYVRLGRLEQKNAILGTALWHSGVLMYYDGMSECGLYMAALNFPGYAVYREQIEGKKNLASGELIPYILGNCQTLDEAKMRLSEINITPDGISGLPSTPMHWLLTDGEKAIVAEPRENGIILTENPHGVLTNSPNIEYQMIKLADFAHISPTNPQNTLANGTKIPTYSRGMGGIGLPGDFSSCSRFVKAIFLTSHTSEIGSIIPQNTEKTKNIYTRIPQSNQISTENSTNKRISAYFHISDQISVPYGSVLTDEGRAVYTVYTSCADLERGVYYLTTYSCRTPHAIALTPSRATAAAPTRFPHPTRELTAEL